MLFEPPRSVLVLAPHTDDEQGCAGTVARLLRAGADVSYVALSRCEESVPQGFPPDVLEMECRSCTSKLGIKPERVQVWRFRVRRFPEVRQEILERFILLKREISPDLVFLPSHADTHQDHAVVYEEGFRAFKCSALLGYELPQNHLAFSTGAFVRLTENDLETKVTALSCYSSQAFRPYSAPSFVESLARVRGLQCGSEFAEAFEAIRLVA